MKRLKAMRWGYSTGTCAAAASRAALLLLLEGRTVSEVEVELPDCRQIRIPVENVCSSGNEAIAEVIKDAGDDLDITDGVSIFARVKLHPGPGIVIKGGAGVGIVSKPGLAVAVGEPAINPVPRAMIERSLTPLLPSAQGLLVEISVPAGEHLAGKTLNPRLGIVGGISILGTSGLVRPMSDEAYLDSLIPQIDQAIALGYHSLVFTPGGMGARRISELGVPAEAVVQTSNFIGQMLDKAVERRVGRILLFGHIGKLIKVSAGIFQTHSKVADARRETMAAYLALWGAPQQTIARIMKANTIEACLPLVQESGLDMIYRQLAEAASLHCQQRCFNQVAVGTAMYSLEGTLLGYDRAAAAIGRELGWEL